MPKLTKTERDATPSSKFAEPEKRAFPIEDPAHDRAAKARASQAVHAGRMSESEAERIDAKADAVLNKGG